MTEPVPPTDVTLCLALDLEHLAELALSWPTWAKHCPLVQRWRLLVFCDAIESPPWWRRQLGTILSHGDVEIVPWPLAPGSEQRGRMLSAFVHGVADHCRTKWYTKIDTDVVCMRRDERFPMADWFDDEKNHVFVSSRWGYTKPARKHVELIEWADTVPELAGLPDPPGQWTDLDGKCKHGRIISFVMFGRTAFVREASALARPAGPIVPSGSQDGFMWFVATKLGRPFLRVRMGHLGWAHSRRKLQQHHDEAMGLAATGDEPDESMVPATAKG